MPTRCPSCPGHFDGSCPGARQIFGDGPDDLETCEVVFVGAGPGKHEAKTGRVRQGPAGQEYDYTYLPIAGMNREDVYTTNATLCFDGSDRTPGDRRIMDCAKFHLPALLDRVQPKVVVLMGGATMPLCDTRLRLDMHHGRPQWTSVLGGAWEGWVWPSFEPALGLRETRQMTSLLDDFRHLGEWWRGEWTPPVGEDDHGTARDYQQLESVSDFDSYVRLHQHWLGRPSVDTESHGRDPWSLQFSTAPSTGRLIRAHRTDLVQAFLSWVRETRATLRLHFAVHDLDELDKISTLAKLGVASEMCTFVDTMQEAFHQCALPQGLKALAYRLLGVTMHSWQDTVWPASVQAMLRWMEDAHALADANLSNVLATELKRGKCSDCGHQHSKGPCKRDGCGCVSTRWTMRKVEQVPSAVQGILKHILTYTAQTIDDDEPYNPWKKLAEMRVEGLRGKKPEGWEFEYLEEVLGPSPILGIGNVEQSEAVRYACEDAAMTGEVADVLERERGSDRWKIAEEDRDQ